MIARKIYPLLKESLKKREILALIGSRQVGKTTLMEKLYKTIRSKKKFITFEEETILNLFENSFEDFVEIYVKNYQYLFIDEFQYAKEGGKKLKFIFDKYKTKIVISGSSAPELTIQSLSFLAGRVFIFEIYPLSFEEFLNYKNPDLVSIYSKNINQNNLPLVEKLFQEFLVYGGYPQIVIQKTKQEKQFVLKNLINTYLLKEIKDILAYKSSYEFENLLKILAITDSTLLNKSNISSDLGIYASKINEMLNVLKNTYILNIIKPYANKKIRELIKSPKTYFQDLGFKNTLLQNFNELEIRSDKGAILENFILSELTKLELSPLFYNYKNSSEVDFLIEKNGKKIALEIKSKLNGLKINKGLKVYVEKYKPDEVYIFNLNQEGETKINNTKITFLHHLNIFRVFKY